MRFSFVVPVYNRPDELEELLESLSLQIFKDFEVVIVEDGSILPSDSVVDKFQDRLDIKYFSKENEGPAIGRNFGAARAQGEFLIFTDSDCILPTGYLATISNSGLDNIDVFGGPDRAHPDFNNVQKAISFSMTSVLTTGGIRGKNKSVEQFYPRSFNMGIRRSIFEEIGGFPNTTMWPGEDMVLAIELNKRQYRLQYINDAFVYHKRRTSIRKFFKQVSNFGKVRVYISQLYPDTLKITYIFPIFFVLFFLASSILLFYNWIFIVPLAFYLFLIFCIASSTNSSLLVGLLSVITSLTQFFGYAFGLTKAFIISIILRKPEYVLNRDTLFRN